MFYIKFRTHKSLMTDETDHFLPILSDSLEDQSPSTSGIQHLDEVKENENALNILPEKPQTRFY